MDDRTDAMGFDNAPDEERDACDGYDHSFHREKVAAETENIVSDDQTEG